MNLVVATIPDDPADLAGWIERRLVGLELDGLVAELTAIHKPAAVGVSLSEALNGQLDEVRQSGLSCLSRDQLRQLLTRPSLLLELQEEILIHGGSYWDNLALTLPVMVLEVEKGRKRLPGTDAPVSPQKTVRPAAGPAKGWYRQAWLVSLATAALVLIAVGAWLWNRPGTQTVAWGWERPGAVKDDASASDYLVGLADAADEWFKKRPDDAPALAKRIGEMRRGCSALIAAPHKPLTEKDREWLVDRCKAWSKDFDQALADLDEGKDVLLVRDRMDAVVNKLSKAIRARANQV